MPALSGVAPDQPSERIILTDVDYQGLTIDQIVSALDVLDPNAPRDDWVKIGMALKDELGESGREIFENWSRRGNNFDTRDFADTWRSIKAGRGVGIGSLIYAAQQCGYRLDGARMSASEIEARRGQREAEMRAEQDLSRRLRGAAAAAASIAWERAKPAETHPYLTAKGVRSYGLAIGDWPLLDDDGAVYRTIPDTLLIPIITKRGRIVSLQGIMPDGTKRYLRHGKKQDGYYLIGSPDEQTVVVCEGYATGATIHGLTGWAVFVAFDAGNLTSVASQVREIFPRAAILVAGDDDRATPGNPGRTKAAAAARAVGGVAHFPVFPHQDDNGTDWNDLAISAGADVARDQLLDNALLRRRDMVTSAANNNHLPLTSPVPAHEWPDPGNDGKPLSTIENVSYMLSAYGVTVRYNMVRKIEEILIPGVESTQDNESKAGRAHITSLCGRNRLPLGPVSEYITAIADRNPYNPALTWIQSMPWDGRSRLEEFYDTVTVREGYDVALRNLLIRKWLISAVAAVAKPAGFWSKGVLVFQGAQSAGKTAWFRRLSPSRLKLQKEGASINPEIKDTLITAVSHWLVELGELDATFRKSDIAMLKAFITQDCDKLRRPYARCDDDFPRRTVFFGSVNEAEFLVDDTGNSRWWVIPIERIDSTHTIDMQQVWAEVLTLFEAGEEWWLSRDQEQQLAGIHAMHQRPEPVRDLILGRLDIGAPPERWVTAGDLLREMGIQRPTSTDCRVAATVLREYWGESRYHRGRKVFCVPRGEDVAWM